MLPNVCRARAIRSETRDSPILGNKHFSRYASDFVFVHNRLLPNFLFTRRLQLIAESQVY